MEIEGGREEAAREQVVPTWGTSVFAWQVARWDEKNEEINTMMTTPGDESGRKKRSKRKNQKRKRWKHKQQTREIKKM